MVWLPDFDAARRDAVSLSERTSLGVGGRADLLFEPATEEEPVEAPAVPAAPQA